MAPDNPHKPTRGKGTRVVRDNVVSLGRDIQVKIGQHLRTMYDEVVKQGVPDHLSTLLQQLDDQSKGQKDRQK
jgi:Anti-sigma factor NepR